MWKNCGKLFVVLLLLLSLASPLAAAWLPFGLGKGDSAQSQEDQAVTIQSLRLLIKDLQTELDATKQILTNSQSDLQTLRTALTESKTLTAKLQSDLTARQSLLEASNANFENLKAEYDVLVAQASAAENESPIRYLIGIGGAYTMLTGDISATATVGIGYKHWAITFGADWAKPSLAVPDISDMTFRTGLQFSF